ncbi:angiotensin-converting enzyme-like [Portunus trituberculatus]|uniref:angiotensin-converting enzyme-like n=1 Tax=Portunus trituberculatus TaxID=210409 RepID=UPI001E1CECAE|nr:angiotensin-converting enzyme-like [Portunus trituberculatus]
MVMKVVVVVAVVVMVVVPRAVQGYYNEVNTRAANELIDKFEAEMVPMMRKAIDITWGHITGVDVTEEALFDAAMGVMELRGQYQEKIRFYLQRPQAVRQDVRRRLRLATSGNLKRADALILHNALANMSRSYDTGRACSNIDIEICKTVPGGIIRQFAEEQNPDKLEEIWDSWHTDLARGLAPDFKMSVSALNDAALSVGFRDYSEEMMKTYEGDLSKPDMVALYAHVQPLYKLLHSYVRSKLNLRFPNEVISLDRPMPVILLGDLFGRFWSLLFTYMKAYPDVKEANITAYIEAMPGNGSFMYRWAEERFLSMGLKPLPDSFYERSIFFEQEHEGREMECQPSAWDMYDGKDFRVYMCTEKREEHLQTIIHLLGHIQYFQYMSSLPFFYRQGANEAFQEAIANVFTLAFTSPTHIYARGFGKGPFNVSLTDEVQMNYLLHVGLALLPTLPYFLGLETWRWKVYEGIYVPEEWNCEYWRLRKYYSGVLPTVYRTVNDLDMLPTHQLAHTETGSRHFTAVFMMFQILEHLCKEEGHHGPLHKCDLYGGKKAGSLLAKAMALGSSHPWPFVYRILTGETTIHAGSLLRYFKPLYEWLQAEREAAGLRGVPGWIGELSPMGIGPDSGCGGVVARRSVMVATVVFVVVAWLLTH